MATNTLAATIRGKKKKKFLWFFFFLSLAGAFVRNTALNQRALNIPISKCLVPLPSTKNRKEGADWSDVCYLGISSTPKKISHPQLGPSAILSTEGTRCTAAEMKFMQPNHLTPSLSCPLLSWGGTEQGPLSRAGSDLEFKIEPGINAPPLSPLFLAY